MRIVGDRPTRTTLVELLLALALLALLLGFALPGLRSMVDGAHVRSAAVEVTTAFAVARHHALARGEADAVLLDSARRAVVVHAGPDTLVRRDLGEAYGVGIA